MSFECDQCSKSFSRPDSLSRHVREVHTKRRRYGLFENSVPVKTPHLAEPSETCDYSAPISLPYRYGEFHSPIPLSSPMLAKHPPHVGEEVQMEGGGYHADRDGAQSESSGSSESNESSIDSSCSSDESEFSEAAESVNSDYDAADEEVDTDDEEPTEGDREYVELMKWRLGDETYSLGWVSIEPYPLILRYSDWLMELEGDSSEDKVTRKIEKACDQKIRTFHEIAINLLYCNVPLTPDQLKGLRKVNRSIARIGNTLDAEAIRRRILNSQGRLLEKMLEAVSPVFVYDS